MNYPFKNIFTNPAPDILPNKKSGSETTNSRTKKYLDGIKTAGIFKLIIALVSAVTRDNASHRLKGLVSTCLM